jgi:NAD(P)H dehydrogenase (quinone)
MGRRALGPFGSAGGRTTLDAGLQEHDRTLLCTGTSERQVHDEIALIDAAVRAGVPYLLNLSVGGAGGGIANNVLEWHTGIEGYRSRCTLQIDRSLKR